MMIKYITLIILLICFFNPLKAFAITEQDIEDEIDYKMGLKPFVHSKTDIADASVNPLLIQLIQKYQGNTIRQKVILELMSKNPEPAMIKPILEAYKNNNDLEDDVFGLLLKINSNESYLAAKDIAFNPKMDAEKKGVDPLNNARVLIFNTSTERFNYIIPHLKEGGFITEWIIDVMTKKGKPELIVFPITELLKAEEEYTRITAIEALGNIGDKSAIPPLKDAMNSEKDFSLRMDIAAQLVKLGEFKELELLVQAVGNMSKDIKSAAAIWLKEVTGQDFGEDAVAWRAWFEEEKTRRGL